MVTEILNYTVNESLFNIHDCGNIMYDFASKVNTNLKIVSIAMFMLILFEWWALNRINHGRLTAEQRETYMSFTLMFIHSLLLFGAFYMVYWFLLSGIDF